MYSVLFSLVAKFTGWWNFVKTAFRLAWLKFPAISTEIQSAVALLLEHSYCHLCPFWRYLKGIVGTVQATCYKMNCKTNRNVTSSSSSIWGVLPPPTWCVDKDYIRRLLYYVRPDDCGSCILSRHMYWKTSTGGVWMVGGTLRVVPE